MNKDFDLSDKVCVIVGAAGLIGSQFARDCAKAGAVVVISDLNEDKGKALVQEITAAEGKAAFFSCNTLDHQSVTEFAAKVVEKFGKVDGMVNAAYPKTPAWGTRFTELAYVDFIKHLELQVGPTFLTAREFGEVMAKQGSGSIVLMGSLYATTATRFEMYEGLAIKPTPVEYTIAKGGLVMLMKYLAAYYGLKGVRVNMLSPGGIWDNHPEEFVKRFGKHVPLGGTMQRKEDLGATLVYFFANASRQVTGQNITIDGGWSL